MITHLEKYEREKRVCVMREEESLTTNRKRKKKSIKILFEWDCLIYVLY